MTAYAVNPNLSIAGSFWAGLARMAKCLTLVTTFFSETPTPLATAILHQLFNTVDAFSRHMTYFLAVMPTLKLQATDLPTVVVFLMAKDICHELFSAIAETGHCL